MGNRQPKGLVIFVLMMAIAALSHNVAHAGQEQGAANIKALEDFPAGYTPDEQLISLTLRKATLGSVLNTLTRKTGISFMVKPELADKEVSLYIADVSIHDALAALLQVHGLWYERVRKTNIYIIKEAPGGPPVETITEIILCKHATVMDLKDIIKHNLTPTGKLTTDERTNSFIVNDTPENIAVLTKLVEKLSQPSRQVLIEVEIVEIDLTAARELGVNWGWTGKRGEPVMLTPDTLKASFLPDVGLWLSLLGDLKADINALENKGVVNLLANPRVLTVENSPATIRITDRMALAKKVTLQAMAGVGVSVSEPIFGDVGVTLTVVPKISGDGFILLDVKPTVSSAERSVYFPDEAVDTKERAAETVVLVKDGQTVVIGGLLREKKGESIAKVPLLGDIPILGYLFKRKVVDTRKTEVAVFLTPHIVSPEELEKRTEQEREKFQPKE